MKTTARAYHSPKRQQQAAETRERILAAFAKLITDEGMDDVSFRAIAGAAGLTEITVYRHYRNREELRKALWSWFDERVGRRGMPRSETALLEDTAVVLAGFDDIAPMMRSALLTKEGRAMRMSMNDERRAGFEQALAGATAGLPPAERRRALAVIQLLYSGYAWLSMRDHWGLTGEEAGKASAWAISVLIQDLHRKQGAGASRGGRKR